MNHRENEATEDASSNDPALSPSLDYDLELSQDLELPIEDVHRILQILRAHLGHDFSEYKPSTIHRRIRRRMDLHSLEEARDYIAFLRAHPLEITALFRELIIGVTQFFRDADAFSALAEHLHAVIEAKNENSSLRVWVPGCSTGEEAYSLAMLIQESLERTRKYVRVQLFATDLDEGNVEIARTGLYGRDILQDVGPERLARFFAEQEDGYRINKEIRDMIIFAPQNIISDPPFIKLDLISCRNLLIYLDTRLQKRLLPLFHYTLVPNGILFLGSSESTGNFIELFKPLDRRWKIFGRLPGPVPYARHAAPIFGAQFKAGANEWPLANRRPAPRPHEKLTEAATSELLRSFVPPTVFVHANGNISHVHGRTGLFLEPSPGEPSMNLFAMARPGLRVEVTSIVRRALQSNEPISLKAVVVETDAGHRRVDLIAQRLDAPEVLAGLVRVSFVPHQEDLPVEEGPPSGATDKELRHELEATRQSLQTSIEELQAANEEQQSTNEELQSTNEELQSANEELETAKEELQSLNEELQTVNGELRVKIDHLSRISDDMNNLLSSTKVATLFLDRTLRIKRFTPQARDLVNIVDADVGRPIGDLVSRLQYGRLAEDARDALEQLQVKEAELQVSDLSAWFLMRISPYRTGEDVIDGVVITFVDISQLRSTQHALDVSRTILHTLKTPLVILEPVGRVVYANEAFCRIFDIIRDETEGRLIQDVLGGMVNEDEISRIIKEPREHAAGLEGIGLTVNSRQGNTRKLTISTRRIQRKHHGTLIAIAFEDKTEDRA